MVQGTAALDIAAVEDSLRIGLQREHAEVDGSAVSVIQLDKVERTLAGKIKLKVDD